MFFTKMSTTWNVDSSAFSDTMTVSAYVSIDELYQGDGMLGAFVGNEVRGVQENPTVPPFGPYAGKSIYQITVYANSGGESINFKFKPPGASEVDLRPIEKFVINGNLGTLVAPVVITGTTPTPTPTPVPPTPVPPTHGCCDESQHDRDARTRSKGWGYGYSCTALKAWCSNAEIQATCCATCSGQQSSCCDGSQAEIDAWTMSLNWGYGYTCDNLKGYKLCEIEQFKDKMQKVCCETCNE